MKAPTASLENSSDRSSSVEGHGPEAGDRNSYVADEYSAAPSPRKSGSTGGGLGTVRSMKGLVLVTLVLAAVALGVMIFVVMQEDQEDQFETAFQDSAAELVVVAQIHAQNLYQAMQSVATVTTSLALYDVSDGSWPNISLPHFEHRAKDVRDLSQASLVVFSPLVSAAHVDGWQSYTSAHQDWVQQGLAFQHEEAIMDAAPTLIHPVVSDASGPFSPVWQMSPVPADLTVVNFDLYRNDVYANLMAFVDAYRQPAMSPVMGTTDVVTAAAWHSPKVNPQSVLIQPIYQDFTEGSPVVGHFLAVVAWDVYFKNVFAADTKAILAVVENSCGDSFTYRIEGANATFLAMGDVHETTYNHLVVRAPLVELPDNEPTMAGVSNHCVYTLAIYPSQDMHDQYTESNDPMIYTIIAVSIFVFVGLAFFAYDYVVRRREKKVAASAEQSNEMIASLFPGNVAQQIFEQESSPSPVKSKELNSCSKNNNDERLRDEPSSDVVLNSGKIKLNNYFASTEEETIAPYGSKPIADLFPNTTVMFADISGFTAWSSVREPSQVFILLETIYQSFDQLAKKHRVFKVETVGDCYVAVAGLPEPRPDHAMAMCQFARDCLQCVNALVSKLELVLGPDTGDLAMRFGLHSGPVTAGVLRGERARFQLFGDTVNTAARIEGTGVRNKIHLSQETADMIKATGHAHWIIARDDLVVAKGKGALQTYWLTPSDDQSNDEASVMNSNNVAQEASNRIQMDEATPEAKKLASNAKVQRLIDWNCELLLQLLTKVVARRAATQRTKSISSALSREGAGRSIETERMVRQIEQRLGEGGTVLDEVVEIIPMPRYERQDDNIDPRTMELSDQVTEQLRSFVSVLASLYRDNPFHCFEHASHVTMSVSKLLSRIVAQDAVEEDMQNNESGGDNEGDRLALALHDHTYGITSDPLTQFAVVLSALIHDVDHRGVSNGTLIQEDPALAAVYRNKSVAEQNSVDLAWNVLMDPTYSALRRCLYTNETELKRFRQLLVNSVMATDIFDKELGALRKQRWQKAFATPTANNNNEESKLPEDEEHEAEESLIHRKATIVIEHLIQASDVAHTMQHWHVYQKWNERLFEEMYKAYQSGRTSNDPAVGWYQGELSFFDSYILPLTQKLKECGVFGVSSDEYLNYALNNRREWEKKGQQVVNNLVKKYQAKYGVRATETSHGDTV